jgi:hypothetical protein
MNADETVLAIVPGIISPRHIHALTPVERSPLADRALRTTTIVVTTMFVIVTTSALPKLGSAGFVAGGW